MYSVNIRKIQRVINSINGQPKINNPNKFNNARVFNYGILNLSKEFEFPISQVKPLYPFENVNGSVNLTEDNELSGIIEFNLHTPPTAPNEDMYYKKMREFFTRRSQFSVKKGETISYISHGQHVDNYQLAHDGTKVEFTLGRYSTVEPMPSDTVTLLDEINTFLGFGANLINYISMRDELGQIEQPQAYLSLQYPATQFDEYIEEY